MKKKIIIGSLIWLSGLAFVLWGGRAGLFNAGEQPLQAAKSSQEINREIEETNQRQKTARQEQKKLQDEIDRMKTEKKDSLENIRQLDGKITTLSEKIDSNQAQIEEVKEEIKKLRQEKKQAKKDMKSQYAIMKKRIKYMYENGNDGYFELLFSSGSLSELFNRTEYVMQVSSYDKNMLKEYQDTHDRIVMAEKSIREKLASLTDMQESLEIEKESVTLLAERKNQELEKMEETIDAKSETLENTEILLAKQEEELENLMAASRAAAEREAKAAEKKESPKKQEKSQETDKKTTDNSNTDTQQNTTTQNVSKGGYRWPLNVAGRITSTFGYRNAPTAGASTFHKGVDIAVPVGTSVLAAKAGTVVTSTYASAAGNYIGISHGGGVYTYYMHCSVLKVSAGTKVSQGQLIALSGNTGVSTGPHLHFAIFAGGNYVNPLSYVSP